MKLDVPKVGMRTMKTAVAVVLSYLVFIPLGLLFPAQYSGASAAPFYACVAAVICMQSSVGRSVIRVSPGSSAPPLAVRWGFSF